MSGLRVSFERAVAFLLPTDPIKKNGGGAKRPIANISSAGGGTGGGGGGKALKPSVGKSGVSLRYHKSVEYAKLNNEQKSELCEWRQNGGKDAGGDNLGGPKPKGNGPNRDKQRLRSLIASVIKEMKEEENSKSEMVDELKSLISSLSPVPEKVKLRAAVAGTVAQDPTQQAEDAAVKLL